jgi:hypothetical protein
MVPLASAIRMRARTNGESIKRHHILARVKADDLVVEAVEPGLALGDQLRFEAAGAITRDFDRNLAVLGQDRLGAGAVAAVAAAPTRRVALLIAKVIAQLRAKRPFDQRFLEPSEYPVVRSQVFGLRITA